MPGLHPLMNDLNNDPVTMIDYKSGPNMSHSPFRSGFNMSQSPFRSGLPDTRITHVQLAHGSQRWCETSLIDRARQSSATD